MSGKLNNKTVLITGGTSGIGKATAMECLLQGARVIITGRNQKTINQTINELGDHCEGFVSDAGNIVDLLKLNHQLVKKTDKIDALFVNAGYGIYNDLERIKESQFDEQFNVLVKGALFTVQQSIPLMQRGGSIILNTSIVTELGMMNSSLYSAAKASVQSFVKNFAAELGPKGIRVNGVSPGPIQTNYFDRSNLNAQQIKAFVDSIVPNLPLDRFGHAAEIASVVSFLASDESSYIHGTELFVDGGFPRIRTSSIVNK